MSTMSTTKKTDGVDLPLFSPRMESSSPKEVRREENRSGIATPAASREIHSYRIGEVSRLTALKPFVLRYWETEFPMLEPVKSARGHRLYRQEDVDLVLRIKRLLYDEGFTIAGARRLLKEGGSAGTETAEGNPQLSAGESSTTQLSRKMLLDLRDGLRSFLTLLESK
jgi:DNA-binding transcriptional MerR regulator